MGQNLEVRSGSITNRPTASLRIPVDDSLTYFIYILDSKIHFPTYDRTMINGIAIERYAKPVSNMIAIKVDIFLFIQPEMQKILVLHVISSSHHYFRQ